MLKIAQTQDDTRITFVDQVRRRKPHTALISPPCTRCVVWVKEGTIVMTCLPYFLQVMPRLIEVARYTRSAVHKKFFLTQIANFVSIVKLGASEHIKDILRLIAVRSFFALFL